MSAIKVNDISNGSQLYKTIEIEPSFFSVSLFKLAIMSIFTAGIYEIYWFYRNWRIIKIRENSNIAPGVRSVFSVFFCYQCFSRIHKYGANIGVQSVVPPIAWAAGWVLITVAARLREPWLLYYLLSFIYLLPMQAHVNRINAAVDSHYAENSKFSRSNWTVIVIGTIMWGLIIVGVNQPKF
ncbi:hypothetical protein BCF11_4228 [Collimonas sp. PA-H2]|nr:hypothetical protein BCF11_4228 [Collimonas sp. PA-H2]